MLVRVLLLFVSIQQLLFAQTVPEDFTLIVFPDTQNESQHYPAVYTSQTQWVANNKTSSNIVFVTHVGDIVNTRTDATQWNNADASMDILDAANVAYSVGPGNHDIGSGSLYETYFGVSRFSGKSWYGGHYGSDNYNNYSLFSASGMDFILINLQYQPTTAQISWANNLLQTYSTRRGIVVQHDLLNLNNTWLNQTSYTTLRSDANLFLMLCGHMHTSYDGAAYLAGSGTDGHTIHVMLADYQDFPNGGNGYLRILRFSPANNMIYATTYSPYINSYITTSPDQMDMAYDMSVFVQTKVLLEGPYNGGSMNTTLGTAGYIPTTQPYNTAPWNYTGLENVTSIPANVVDWVLVELRTGTAASTKVAARAAFLKSGGSIVDLNGTSAVGFGSLAPDNHYIVIRHRNHLAVMSAGAVPLGSSSSLYDFTIGRGQYYGGDAKNLGGGVYGLYAGDYSADAIIDAGDFVGPDNEMFLGGYRMSDLNLDGIVDAADFVNTDNNMFKLCNVP